MESVNSTYPYANWVLAGLGVYMVVMLAIGWYSSRLIKSTSDFLVAGRRLGIPLATGTLFATWFGSGTAMGGAGNAYLYGNQGVIFDPWGAALCLVLVGFFFARWLRRGRYLTLVDLFESRYGRTMGVCCLLTTAAMQCSWLGAQLVGFGAIIHFFGGVSLAWGIAISTALIVTYTFLGGMWSVTLTDAAQLLILTAGMTVLLFAGVEAVGGWENVFPEGDAGRQLNKSGLEPWAFLPTSEDGPYPPGFLSYTGYMGWFYWLAAWFSVGLGGIAGQDLMQRVFSARDGRTATVSCVLSGFFYLTVGMIPVLLGMIYFQLKPDLADGDAMNKLLLFMAVDYLPPWLTVIFVSALVAALMSSADSAVLAASSVLGHNAYRMLKPSASGRETLLVTRIAIPLVAGAALLLALVFEAIYNLMVLSVVLTLVALLAPLAAAYWWRKANHAGAVTSYVGGFATWVVMYFVHRPYTIAANTAPDGAVNMDAAMWDSLYISSVWGLIASVVLLVAVSLLTQRLCPPEPLRDVEGKELLPFP
jgi:SSS family transporter